MAFRRRPPLFRSGVDLLFGVVRIGVDPIGVFAREISTDTDLGRKSAVLGFGGTRPGQMQCVIGPSTYVRRRWWRKDSLADAMFHLGQIGDLRFEITKFDSVHDLSGA